MKNLLQIVFIHTKEFYTFLCQHKGALVRANTEGNPEEEMLGILQEKVDQAMKEMMSERGMLLLKDAGVLIYSGWDMRSALLFDSFLKR